jgi:PDZ domain-containing protein
MVIVGLLVPVPYAIEQPGPAIDVLGEYKDEQVITIDGQKTYPTDGELMMTTVSVTGGPGYPVTGPQVIRSWLDPTRAVLPRETVFPTGQTQEQTDEQNAAAMTGSQDSAIAVALDELDIDYDTTVLVSQVSEGAPADGLLEPGDQVLAINGEMADDAAGFQKITQEADPDTPLAVSVRRDGTDQTVPVPTEMVDGTPRMGIVLAAGYDFPFEVTIGVGDVGGPSAGTMFALGVYDDLTPGALTGGESIAGTGTIAADGAVGAIGGIRQKMVGAQESGAEFFLAPADNCADVVGHEPDGMSVVKVETFEDALHATESIAESGDAEGLPVCTSDETGSDQ